MYDIERWNIIHNSCKAGTHSRQYRQKTNERLEIITEILVRRDKEPNRGSDIDTYIHTYIGTEVDAIEN